MPFYETVFIARQDLTEAQVNDMTEKFSKVIKAEGGKVTKTEYWGLRTLAYRINKNRKAHYVLIESDAPAAAIIEMERLLRIEEDVVRSLTVRLEKLSEGPSVVMDKTRRDDDDRGPRRDRDYDDRGPRRDRESRDEKEAA
jgi:small subunit ribosomal protein S6